jgi:hypothetical protein
MNWQMMLTNQQTKTNNKSRKTATKRIAAGSGGMMLWRFAQQA